MHVPHGMSSLPRLLMARCSVGLAGLQTEVVTSNTPKDTQREMDKVKHDVYYKSLTYIPSSGGIASFNSAPAIQWYLKFDFLNISHKDL